MSTGIGDAASFSGFSRGGERFGGETESRGNGSDYGSRGGGIHTNGDDLSVSGSETVRSSGLGESASIVSEVSSGGLPAPPLIPSGPLPAIGVIREYFLTGQQQHDLDHERRLTSDHMRRLNQVLAGHLSYLEVSNIHAEREKLQLQALASAPSHGAAVGYSASLNDSKNASGTPRGGSLRQNILRRLMGRVCRDRAKRLIFRGWSRLCLAASLSTAEGTSAVATAAVRAARPEVMEKEAEEATETVENPSRAANVSAEVAIAREHAQREAASVLAAEHHRTIKDTEDGAREHQLRRTKMLITRVCRERDRASMFCGWNRLYLHAATLSTAEGAAAAAVMADSARGRAMEEETGAAAGSTALVETPGKVPREWEHRLERMKRLGASAAATAVARAARADAAQKEAEAAAASPRETAFGSKLMADLELKVKKIEQTVQEHQLRRVKGLGASAATTSAARATRSTAMEMETEEATDKTEVSRRAEDEIENVAAAREQARRETARGSNSVAKLQHKITDMEAILREHQLRWIKILITRVCGDRDRRSLFRSWSRLCLHAASVGAIDDVSAAAAEAARVAKADAVEKQAPTPAERAKVSEKGHEDSMVAADLEKRAEEAEKAVDEQRRQQTVRMVARVLRDRNRRLLFRSWGRLCSHAASLNAVEGASAAATPAVRAARVEAKEMRTAAAASSTDAIEAKSSTERSREEEQEPKRLRATTTMLRVSKDKDRRLLFRGWSRLCLHAASLNAADAVSATATAAARAARAEAEATQAAAAATAAGIETDAAVVRQRVAAAESEARDQRERRALHMICSAGRDYNRRLLFHGWSRLCRQATSVHIAEGSSTAAEAIARPDVMEKPTHSPAEHAKASEKVDGDSVMATTLVKRAQEAEKAVDNQKRQLAARLGASTAATPAARAARVEVQEKETAAAASSTDAVEAEGSTERRREEEQGLQRHRALTTISRVSKDKDRRLLFRGWSRLCLHAASLNAADAVSATATAAARAARAEAEATAAAAAATAAGIETDAAVVRQRVAAAESEARDQRDRRALHMICSAGRGYNRRLLFHGWSRLCRHAAGKGGADGISSDAEPAAAQAARADAMEKQVHASAKPAEGAKGVEKLDGESVMAATFVKRAEEAEKAVDDQRRQLAARMVTRVLGDRIRCFLFRSWGRLRSDAASLAAAERAPATAASVVRTARVEPEEKRTAAAASSTDAIEAEVSTGRSREQGQELQRHRAMTTMLRVSKDKDRRLLFRGWSRLCLHAASLNAADAVSATATAAARAARAEAEATQAAAAATAAGIETDAAVVRQRVAAAESEARDQRERRALHMICSTGRDHNRRLLFHGWSRLCRHAAFIGGAEGLSADAYPAEPQVARVDVLEKTVHTPAGGAKASDQIDGDSVMAATLVKRAEEAEKAVDEQSRQLAARTISRVFIDKDRRLLFRGWSRLCLHAASLNAADAVSATATSAARAARAEAEATQAAAAATAAEIETDAAVVRQRVAAAESEARDQRERRALQMVARVLSDRNRRLLFRSWGRLRSHPASLAAVERSPAAAAPTERAVRVEAQETGAAAAAASSTDAVEAKTSTERSREEEQETNRVRARTTISRVCKDKDRRLLFRGWSRLCLHAASLNAADAVSATATAAARAARAEAEATQAAAAATAAGIETDAAVVRQRVAAAESEARDQRERRALHMICSAGRDYNRRLLFHGWSQLCRHSAPLHIAEGSSKAAEAIARSDVMQKSEHAPAEQAKASEKADGESVMPATLVKRAEEAEKAVDNQKRQLAARVVARVLGDRNRRLMFRSWGRLCSHFVSLNAAEGSSAAATPAARAVEVDVEGKGSAKAISSIDAVEEEGFERSNREKELKRLRAVAKISRAYGDTDKRSLFRGWSRLCLHAASLSAAEGASAAATATARAARAEAMQKEAEAAAEKAEAWKRAAAASVEVAEAREKAQREAARGSTLASELQLNIQDKEEALRQHQLRRTKMLGAAAAATATARSARAEAMEKEAKAAADKAEAWRRAAAASVEVAEAREKAQRETARRSELASELQLKVKDTEEVVREHQLRRLKMLIARVCGERDRALVFRGWSRLCLHAASLSAAEGGSAAATAAARAARAEAMEKEAKAAADKAEAWRRAAAASAEVAEAREKAQREAARGSELASELQLKVKGTEEAMREHQLHRLKMLITRVCGESDRALMFRGWSRLCLHAASLSAAEGVSAAATAAARAARAEAMEKEAEAAAASAEVAEAREKAQREAARGSELASKLQLKVKDTEEALRQHQLRRLKMLISRVCGESDRALKFRGWSRLCLHAASLSAAEGASAAATAAARAARAEAMEKEAKAAADKAEAWRRAAAASVEVAEAREKAQREAARGSELASELQLKVKDTEEVVREHQLHRLKMLITRVCGESDRALVFRGWSRLCLHAASLSAAEGASAAATAAARAARAEAMEKEAKAAADKAEAWRRAAAASVEVAEAREKAQREAARGSELASELQLKVKDTEEVAREHQLHRLKMLIARVCERDRALMFRGWSRLCLHAASLSAAEGAAAAATAAARAARAEAMEKEAKAAADKAEAWRRAAAASAEVAEAREKAQREAARGSELASELQLKVKDTEEEVREHQLHRLKMLTSRVCGERDRALMFRGWSRLCLHAASLSAAEGASAAATAAARAARAEAMEKEAEAAADKAEAWRRAAAASVEVAEARERAQREAARGSVLAAELKLKVKDTEEAVRDRQLHRLKMLGAAAAATAAARAARAEAMEKEAKAAADKAEASRRAAAASAEVAAATEQAQRETSRGSELASELQLKVKDTEEVVREHQLRRIKMLIIRVCGESDKALMFRGWSRLCLHAASLSAAEGGAAAATAAARAARAEAMEKEAKVAADKAEAWKKAAAASVEVAEAREKAGKMAREHQLHRLKMLGAAAGATAAARAARAEAMEKEAKAAADKAEAWKKAAAASVEVAEAREKAQREAARGLELASELKLKVKDTEEAARHARELDKKTRALAILLQDDWANAVLKREKETRAVRLQLAQADADLGEQLDSIAGLAVGSKRRARKASVRHSNHAGGGHVGEHEEEKRETTGHEPEVFLGEGTGGIGMVALQGEGARRLRAYVASKGRDLKRARVESEQWRVRCEAMQRRLTNVLQGEEGSEPRASTNEGKKLAAILLNMLDERDRRTHIHRLSHEVQRLETALRSGGVPHSSGRTEFDVAPNVSAGAARHGEEGASRGGFSLREEGVLVETTNTMSPGQGGHGHSIASIDDVVQSATDAHELVRSLRSEVSALERHRATLQANLMRIEDASAATGGGTATTAGVDDVETTNSSSKRPTSDNDEDEEGRARRAVATPGLNKQLPSTKTRPDRGRDSRKRSRVERRARAAAVLRQAVHGNGGEDNEEPATGGGAVEAEEARVVLLAREERQRAQEVFVSRRVARA
ncbi:hypothetical protein Esi_0059_0111 [Ectocarpus siliculosus]|uniref:Uncharacterized protein n=1 Tax=Ectocarpus siliculosus TaxID=2880 RepID=D8LQ96_ECTSI|nr:hypothetical protein Esi_0059_0111 [Ectocarpus siliculosus]|eukprot:CBN77476.1 hypothetical protein Esi_0059_0111 [Ectocarpus siliculosus]